MTEPCPSHRLVDQHFAGTIAPANERELRAHLGACASCRLRYERFLLLARFDHRIRSAEDRLAHGLGLRAHRRARSSPMVVALGLAAALAIVLLQRPDPPAYLARGGVVVESGQALYVYRIAPGGAPQPVVSGVIGPRDELAFAYRNRAGWSRLLVYAVDRAGRVYWYHPGWLDATTSPVAVQIEPGPERHELPEAIAQPLPHGELEIHAIFTDDAADVLAIERGGRPAQHEELVIPVQVTEEDAP